MKKLFTAVAVTAALLTGTHAFSDDATPLSRKAIKEIAITAGFNKIVAGNNIQLVLIQDPNKSSVIIKGDKNYIDVIKVNISNGVLTINSRKNVKGRNIKIYVPVSTLTSLAVSDEASVTTDGIVKLDNLKVTVEDGSLVNLHVIGSVRVEPGRNCDFVYETYEKSKVVEQE